MGSLESLKGKRVHTRSIKIETFVVDEDRIVIEGVLEDTRYVAIRTISGRDREPGPVHGMVARLLVGGMPPKILDAEAEMPEVPIDECLQVRESVKKLIDLPIVYGFSKEVKNRLGGTGGCMHLTSLILTMGAASMQGLATNRGQKIIAPQTRAIMINYVKDSCWVWRGDGDNFKNALEDIEKAEKDAAQ